jgi:hypothetical protein
MKPKPAPQPEFFLESSPPVKGALSEPKISGLLNAAKVRRYALDLAQRERHHHFTAVSVEFIQRIEARLKNMIRDEIQRHPSRGKRLS